jgi:hypothetical protein
LSSWRDQTEEQQRAIYNEIGLGDFEEVESLEMLDPDFKPIAGDIASYPSHADWFSAVLAKQARHREELARRLDKGHGEPACTDLSDPF